MRKSDYLNKILNGILDLCGCIILGSSLLKMVCNQKWETQMIVGLLYIILAKIGFNEKKENTNDFK